jgi:hypothetical protein
MLSPDTMVATDAMPLLHDGQQVDDTAWPLPPGTVTHPRTAGTFTRTLRRYVREDGAMDVTEAIRPPCAGRDDSKWTRMRTSSPSTSQP